MQLIGAITSVGKHSNGTNARGPWSIQILTVKSGDRNYTVKVWGRPDFSSAKGRQVGIDGLEETVDRDGKTPILELKDGVGEVTVKGDSTPPPTGSPAAHKSDSPRPSFGRVVPTQSEYDEVLGHAIKLTAEHLAKHPSLGGDSFRTIGEIVKGYMTAYAKGDFVKESKQDPDIPF